MQVVEALNPQRFFVGDLDYMHGRRTPEAVTWAVF